jgi:hypothetical protein
VVFLFFCLVILCETPLTTDEIKCSITCSANILFNFLFCGGSMVSLGLVEVSTTLIRPCFHAVFTVGHDRFSFRFGLIELI